ncbi:hypothetical protein SynRS9902_01164 [Synechococcus sp. RS9902]|nr:hypothetical protein SynRS9902_01164 [Synechococcus sp. RS9902]
MNSTCTNEDCCPTKKDNLFLLCRLDSMRECLSHFRFIDRFVIGSILRLFWNYFFN